MVKISEWPIWICFLSQSQWPRGFFFISGIYFENLVLLSSSIFFSSESRCFSYAYFLKEDCILEQLSSQWYWCGTKMSRIALAPAHAQPPPLSWLLTRRCIVMLNPHWHVVTTPSPSPIAGSLLLFVRSVRFRQIYPLLWYHTEYVPCLKTLCALFIPPSPHGF